MSEKWVRMKKYPEYLINYRGKIKREHDNKIMKTKPNKHGVRICICRKPKTRTKTYIIYIARELYLAFIDSELPDTERVDYKDNDKSNLSLSNLIKHSEKIQFDTNRENFEKQQHSFLYGGGANVD